MYCYISSISTYINNKYYILLFYTYLEFAYVVERQIMVGFAFIGTINVVVVVIEFHLLGHTVTPECSWRLQRGRSSIVEDC